MTINNYNGGIYFPQTTHIYPTYIPPTTNMLPSLQSHIYNGLVGTIGEKFTPVNSGNCGSHVILIIDESGSMASIRDATISSINEYIQNQKIDAENNGIKTILSIYKFDGYTVKSIMSKVDVFEIPLITYEHYNPNGMTNLNDAFGSVIATINNDLAELDEKNRPSVIITMITDGAENSSTSFTLADINAMVGKCKDKNWAFLFIGANIDAFQVGSNYGFGVDNTLQFKTSQTGMASTMSSATRMTNSIKYARSVDSNASMDSVYNLYAFTDEERKKSLE